VTGVGQLQKLEDRVAGLEAEAGVVNGPPPPEIDGIIAKLRADIIADGGDPDEVPERFQGLTPEQTIDAIMVELAEGQPALRDANGNLASVHAGTLRPRGAPAPKEEEVEEVKEKEPLPVYRLRCLRSCERGLGLFRVTCKPADIYTEEQEITRVSRMLEEPSSFEARKIIARFKCEPQRGKDWEVVVDGGT
jgi:hypothetical protein